MYSIGFKIDLLLTKFSQFDIISLTETFLGDNCPVTDLSFPSFHAPERKDRVWRCNGVCLRFYFLC